MFTFMRQSGSAATPLFIAADGASGGGGGSSYTLPVHAAGDLILLIAKKTGATPAANAGFATPTNGTWATDPLVDQRFRFEWVIDTGNTINSITHQANVITTVMVYRGVSTVGALAVANFSTNPAGVLTLAAPALAASGGGSMMLFCFTTISPPVSSVSGSLTSRYSHNTAGLGSGDAVFLDTNALVSSAPAATGTFGSATFATAQTIELMPL